MTDEQDRNGDVGGPNADVNRRLREGARRRGRRRDPRIEDPRIEERIPWTKRPEPSPAPGPEPER